MLIFACDVSFVRVFFRNDIGTEEGCGEEGSLASDSLESGAEGVFG